MTKSRPKQKKGKSKLDGLTAKSQMNFPFAEPLTQYRTFHEAYDTLNQRLFHSELASCPMITQQRQARSLGHFGANRWDNRENHTRIHEINLNPDGFTGKSDQEILSTLAHEMCHAWRNQQADPPKRIYHDKLWAQKMQQVGLMPSHTGMAGGKTTGQKMNHYILDNGEFAQVYAELKREGFRLRWQSTPVAPNGKGKKKDASKTKFTCSGCGQNMWGKETGSIDCHDCMIQMFPEVQNDA